VTVCSALSSSFLPSSSLRTILVLALSVCFAQINELVFLSFLFIVHKLPPAVPVPMFSAAPIPCPFSLPITRVYTRAPFFDVSSVSLATPTFDAVPFCCVPPYFASPDDVHLPFKTLVLVSMLARVPC